MRTTHGTIILALLLAGFGCDGGTVTPDGGPIDLEDGSSGGDDDAGGGGGSDAGDEDAGTDPVEDGNDDFATASDITPGASEVTAGEINPAGDLDYYTFEGTEGQWIQILARVEETTPRADPAITLYDSGMNVIADNDDLLPRFDNLASEIITRLPAAGTYYVLVQEWSTWADDEPVGGAAYDYEVEVTELDPEAPIVNVETEAGDTAADAQALTEQPVMGGGVSYTVGTFDDATDVDAYSFTLTGGANSSYSVNLMPEGLTGNGAAGAPSRLRITNADGTETIASVDPSAFNPLEPGTNVEFAPSLPAGDYVLLVEGGETADFYVIKAFRGGDNPAETMDATNGVAATPEAVLLSIRDDVPNTRSGFILATLGDGDTDYFSIVTEEGEAVSISCGSRSLGSGVVDLEVALLDEAGTSEIATETESATEGVLIDDATVPAAGTYLVRLTKASQDAEVTGNYVRCGFHAAPPTDP